MELRERRERLIASLLAAVALIPLAVAWASGAVLQPVHPWAASFARALVPWNLFFGLVAMVLVPFGVFGAVLLAYRGRSRGLVLHWFAVGVGAWIGLSAMIDGRDVQAARPAALATVARNGEPVVEAIERFRGRYGRVPDSLNELVPGFLPKMPSTGLPEAGPLRSRT